jgi:aspartate/methionine/tyrosine aminotransferase
LAHRGAPLVVVCDDAYQGLFHESSVYKRSLFYHLAADASPEWLLPVKVDGATKELAFFGGRVGFLTFATNESAGEALNDKAIAISRATVSSLPGPSQQVVLGALKSPHLDAEVDALRALLARRYRVLRSALSELDGTGITAFPFNSGCFALLGLPSGQNAGELRKHLIDEFSVGLIVIESANALRVAYCSMAEEDLMPMIQRLKQAVSAGG